jgi:hypothetical protein
MQHRRLQACSNGAILVGKENTKRVGEDVLDRAGEEARALLSQILCVPLI